MRLFRLINMDVRRRAWPERKRRILMWWRMRSWRPGYVRWQIVQAYLLGLIGLRNWLARCVVREIRRRYKQKGAKP